MRLCEFLLFALSFVFDAVFEENFLRCVRMRVRMIG